MTTLTKAAVVLLADTYNVSIFNQIWLVESGILTKDEILNGQTLQSPVAVNVVCDDFELLIVSDRAQLTFHKKFQEMGEIVKRIFKGITANLPHTPFMAIGINLDYQIEAQGNANFNRRIKSIFLTEQNPLAKHFQADDARFGLYLSQDVEPGVRLRLDIKPIPTENGNDAESIKFNFHKELRGSADKVIEVNKMLDRWAAYLESANSLTNELKLYLGDK